MILRKYRKQILYAVCVEETDAWLIPLFEIPRTDTASKVRPKEYLQGLIGDLKDRHKYVDTDKKNLNYASLGKLLKKKLRQETPPLLLYPQIKEKNF